MSKIMVLNDGTTFSNLSGCQIFEAGDLTTDEVEEYLGFATDYKVHPDLILLKTFDAG